MNEPTKKKVNRTGTSASIQLKGSEKESFDKVKDHMEKIMPGIHLDNASVIRHSLHLASQYIYSNYANKESQ